jgi:hypothetical protein
MTLSRSRPWLRLGLATSVGSLLLALWCGAAAAQTPIKVKLSISGPNTDRTQYPAIRLPDGSITDYGFDSCNVVPAIALKLEVWFRGQSNPTNVTQSPATSFSSIPNRIVESHKALLSLNDIGQSVTFRASYTSNGITLADSLTVKIKLFEAPRFYSAGGSQQSLLREIDALARAVGAWSGDPALHAELGKLRTFVSLWWSGKLSVPILVLGDKLVQRQAPPELLIQLSRLAQNLASAGLIRLRVLGDGYAELSFVTAHPPWLPLPQFLAISCGPILVSWYGLAR